MAASLVSLDAVGAAGAGPEGGAEEAPNLGPSGEERAAERGESGDEADWVPAKLPDGGLLVFGRAERGAGEERSAAWVSGERVRNLTPQACRSSRCWIVASNNG
jgi:hypothetical protein